MPRKLYIILVIFWLFLSGIAVFIVRDGEKADLNQSPASFLSGQYLIAKKASRLKEINLRIPSAEGYLALFDAMEGRGLQTRYLSEDLTYYQKISGWAPSLADAYSMTAFCYYYLGDAHRSADNFQKALLIDPQNFWNYYDLAVILWQNGAFDQARQIMALALRLDPRSTLEKIASSKVYVDLLPFRQGYSPVESLEKAYHIGQLLMTSLDPDTKAIINSQARIRFF